MMFLDALGSRRDPSSVSDAAPNAPSGDPRKLIRWSNFIAWPAVVVLILGVPQVRKLGGDAWKLVLVVSISMIIGGAVMGQIGRSRLKESGKK